MTDTQNFRKIYYNTLQMFVDRDYDMKKYLKNKKLIQITDEQIAQNGRIIVNSNKDKKVHIQFFDEKMGVNEIKHLFEELNKEKVTHFVFITKYGLTSYAKKEMNKSGKNMEIEIFKSDKMLTNITKHFLVPKHELLTAEETKLFFKKIGKKIPHIKKNDPVCRYYNGKIDQVFRIYRQKELYFRIVAL